MLNAYLKEAIETASIVLQKVMGIYLGILVLGAIFFLLTFIIVKQQSIIKKLHQIF